MFKTFKFKAVLFFVLVLSITVAVPFPINAAASNPAKTVSKYLCEKMYSLVSRNLDSIDKYYSEQWPDSKKFLLFTKMYLLQDYLIPYASNNYAIEKVSPRVKIIHASAAKNTATIEALLQTEIYWNASNALGKPIMGVNYEKHLIVLNKENFKWKIISDKYMTQRGPSDDCINEDTAGLSEAVEILKKQAGAALDSSKRSRPSRLIPDNMQDKITFRNPDEYNRAGAYNWAKEHWKTYSKAYVNLGDQTWEGGDCTNFISQCLRAGNAKNDMTGSYQWYYKGASGTSADSYSWTWSIARGLNYILLGNYNSNEFGPKGTEKVISGDYTYTAEIGKFMTYGDIIQYEWSPNSGIKHSAIVVGMVYDSTYKNYEPVIATHTFDAWNLPWTKNAYKTHFIHITGIN